MNQELSGKKSHTASELKFKFLMLTSEQAQAFNSNLKRGSASDLLIWMLALNALRVTTLAQCNFTPRWRHGLNLSRKVVYRSLMRLNQAGLLCVQFRRGKSPVVSLANIPSTNSQSTT